MKELSPVAELFQATVIPFLILFSRISALIFLMPGLGMRVIPMRVRLACVLAITFLLLPAISLSFEGTAGELVPTILSEIIVGLYLGIMVRVFFVCPQHMRCNYRTKPLSITNIWRRRFGGL